jgi:hypothetical protein
MADGPSDAGDGSREALTRTISRHALFDEVWTRPLTKIAPEFGITDVGLRKICSRHGIPTPLRGYWTKVAAGQVFPRPALRPARTPSREVITIVGSPRPSLQVQAAVERARAALVPTAESHKAVEPEQPGPTVPQVAQSAPAIELHRHAQRTQTKLAGAKGEDVVRIAGKGLCKVTATAGQADRVGQLLSHLIATVEAVGWQVESRDDGLWLIPDGEPITFEITERTDRVKHEVTSAEAAALQKHEERRQRAARRGEWFSDYDKPRIPQWDNLPNGLLTLQLAMGLYRHDGIRRRFSDTKHKRVEGMMEQVVASLAAFAASEKANRELQERLRLEAIEAQKRREEAARRQELENKRAEFLAAQLKRLAHAREIEAFIREIEQAGPADGVVASFLAWSRKRAVRLRSTLSHAVLSEKLERLDLMNDQARIYSWVDVD